MVVLNRIYTRTGDDGTTALSDGSRTAKHDLRVEAYGTVDEANATLGLARLHANSDAAAAISRVQNELFDLGADLSRPRIDLDAGAPYPVLRIIPAQVARIEAEIDAMTAILHPLRSFILPGGSALAAHLHLARTTVRRAERLASQLRAATGDVNPAAVHYLNRLSDWLFTAARIANDNGAADILWVPGATRDPA
ncbi:cob(I)yrinic acid a,c-diamide adenosyltransferase [Ketogulonicigenium vulgare]|uniref:Corrinoid adenosyltransferase n=1 Tax=Ketogulonicigenium vulgare (strain WSH-001) TaxID=759362 RepID=F9Y5N9_KETVW|nr:cob(I)yrinic acid a,c-diamide adenosyltransferase [Ketogulonicigenium vulgare]ADO43695.1 Cob(I)yrinic acid a,c-diamide adenosyltransferase [Ketogulonicigenium vulgare Y25]AEM41964.1 Cobalamin adenosyltransferase, methylmalonyl-CoA mutase cofactor biosynthesis protein [Ketogulonicigenium vulgare WSH-001]ALJ82064.1 cob(I)yrinic acid a c-diamide adenosyltransferase [Ketogulonicigenium vulgare]ANW34691.1 ATP:cob(I)alamin adenosyltransferase [Ketogulonicigenium vulgare]AOZ55729.1 Cob(I)yrinic ac